MPTTRTCVHGGGCTQAIDQMRSSLEQLTGDKGTIVCFCEDTDEELVERTETGILQVQTNGRY